MAPLRNYSPQATAQEVAVLGLNKVPDPEEQGKGQRIPPCRAAHIPKEASEGSWFSGPTAAS